MNERQQARDLVNQLAPIEQKLLIMLIAGQSLATAAMCMDINGSDATDIKDSMMWRLGAVRDADAVRIGLLAGLG